MYFVDAHICAYHCDAYHYQVLRVVLLYNVTDSPRVLDNLILSLPFLLELWVFTAVSSQRKTLNVFSCHNFSFPLFANACACTLFH